MNINDAIIQVAYKHCISVEEATDIIMSYYKDVYNIMKDKQGALILIKGLGFYQCYLKASRPTLNKYLYDINCLIAIRDGRLKNPFTKDSGYIHNCHKTLNVLGSIVLSQIDYYYNVQANRKNKFKKQVDVLFLCAIIRRLDVFIGAAFHEDYCKTENFIQEKYLQRLRTQGLLSNFRIEFEIPACAEVQRLWLHPEIKDSIANFTMPGGNVVKP